MHAVVVRPATAADLPALVAAFGQEHYFAERLERQAAGAGELFVAWLDGVPVGDVSLSEREEASLRATAACERCVAG